MKTLVIIDDEQEMEGLYKLLLETPIEKEEIDFHFFADSRDFAEWLKDHRPDLVLCDLNMPHISGVEIGKLIRNSGLHIPLYFVSGYEAADYKDIMQELEVTEFLAKPLDYDRVLNSINSELGL